MLRKARARWLAVATAAAVVGLAALFAGLRYPPGAAAGPPPGGPAADAPTADPERQAAGRAAFERLACTRCHAIDGAGNPALPLDGVGARLDPAALRDWTLGTGVAEEALPRGIARAKQRAAQDPEIDVLVEYLRHSR